MKKFEVTHHGQVTTKTEGELNKFMSSLGMGKLNWLTRAFAHRAVGVEIKGNGHIIHVKAV